MSEATTPAHHDMDNREVLRVVDDAPNSDDEAAAPGTSTAAPGVHGHCRTGSFLFRLHNGGGLLAKQLLHHVRSGDQRAGDPRLRFDDDFLKEEVKEYDVIDTKITSTAEDILKILCPEFKNPRDPRPQCCFV